MLKNLFKKKSEAAVPTQVQNVIHAPITGRLLPLSEVPDPVFSEKMMGDGFAILPEAGEVFSPVSGKVVNVFPTKHALGLLSDAGQEILIHVGMDTVILKGEGFQVHVKEGDKITSETLLLTVDLEGIREKVPSLITPVIFTNLDGKSVHLKKSGTVTHGEADIIEIK